MKTAIVELDAGGRGSHGQSKYLVQHGPARPACGTLREFAGPLLEHAGLCGTMLDHAGPFAGHAGHDWPIAHDRPLHDSKKVGSFVEIGGQRPPLPLLPVHEVLAAGFPE